MKVILIGAGNVATHLGLLLKRKGHKIVQVYSRSVQSSSRLAGILRCEYTTRTSGIIQDADIYIVALRDEVIKPFLKNISFNPELIVHTSGSLGLHIFPGNMENSGVLYPVQTFSKQNKISPLQIPFCIEGINPKSLKRINKLAHSLSTKVIQLNSEDRMHVHMAAVFSNNFTNYLFMISEKILRKRKISFDMLRPLIEETTLKLMRHSPEEMQTGPARRGDKSVIQKHINMLDKEQRKIYRLFSKMIEKDFHK